MKRTVWTRAALLEGLRSVGVAQGGAVFVHASMGAMGPVLGGARTVVAALADAVGAEGTLAMPAFSIDAYPASRQLGRDLNPSLDEAVPGFDAALSPAAGVGAIAETFRTWPGTRRSGHPVVSICARGPAAAGLVRRHALAFACGEGTPLHSFALVPDSKVLLLGVGWNRCSLLHTAETLAAHQRVKHRRFLWSDPETGERFWRETSDVADDGDRLFPLVGERFEEMEAVARGHVGAAEARVADAASLLGFASGWIDRRNAADGVVPG
ncbi:aminoglycoside 3-N-acetyltransferase [Hasllibacter halocynthiae]|uniref:Aminoglycoside N(3)-acetyltransferase n=1 Tax=Hasllibacter halocynthiae TaxID=595589 RepID=A0A2T0X3X1_9RHOB|nr:AAC(3) family N-acetyltransferase [Hasllibacter halocynthiae]PRY93646.1 aminoglycoside 3-N-acetyltransferase [Hasllibacter halocynthiae]